MSKPKVIAFYLPQFHQIPENDKFWGEGFTDWVLVKKAIPLFKGHQQPNVPLNNNYYDLSEKKDVEWQCNLAYENGIHGFGVYHYWFNDETNLLTKPAEIMRDNQNIKTKYFFIWDNCNWKRTWSEASGNDWSPIMDNEQNVKQNENPLLIEYNLGDKENWKEHYNYLKPHFMSKNYEKKGNKPLFGIINYNEDILKMCEYWNQLAMKDGFDGIHFIYKYNKRNSISQKVNFDLSYYLYEPHNSAWGSSKFIKRIKSLIHRMTKGINSIYTYKYSSVWRSLIRFAKLNKISNLFYCGFVGYDDTPRRGKKRSRVIKNKNTQDFRKYFTRLYNISKQKGKDYLFLTAWNEWTEGAYLEPDKSNKFEYLNEIKKITKF